MLKSLLTQLIFLWVVITPCLHAQEFDAMAGIDKQHALVVNENRFIVDNQTRGILCLLSSDAAQSIELISPSGKIWKLSDTHTDITWQKIENLYAIDIKNPESGQWQIKGKFLQNPEVLVRSDLKMNTPNLPNNMIRGETLKLRASLTAQNKILTQGSLLENTSMTASMQNMATSEKYQIVLNHLKNGMFEYQMKLDNLPGVYEVVIQASGLMFQRVRKQQFFLHDYPATISTEVDGQRDVLSVVIKLVSPLIEKSTCEIAVFFTDHKGKESGRLLNKNEAGDWFLIYNLPSDVEKMQVVLTGYLKDSRQVHVIFPSVNVAQMLFNAHQVIKEQIKQNSDQFWQAMFDQELMRALPYTPDRFVSALLLMMKAYTPIVEENRYPTYEQEMIKSYYDQKYDVLRANMLVEKAKSKAKAQAQAAPQTRLVTKTAPHPLKRYRFWLIGIFSMFTLLFVGVLIFFIMQFVSFRKKAAHDEAGEGVHTDQKAKLENKETTDKEVHEKAAVAPEEQTSIEEMVLDSPQVQPVDNHIQSPKSKPASEQRADL